MQYSKKKKKMNATEKTIYLNDFLHAVSEPSCSTIIRRHLRNNHSQRLLLKYSKRRLPCTNTS